jgi:SAM-dependent methyltransferase
LDPIMVDMSSLDRIHRRYVEQAAWTADVRARLLDRLPAAGARLLEVGAGTGAIAGELAATNRAAVVFALDIDLGVCAYGARIARQARWHCADAHALPLETASLDAVLFHYVLLWLDDPAQALSEAARVTRPGGWVFALAEPDHAARLDYPELLARLGERQTGALAAQGADVRMGRKLRGLFAASGLADVTTGVLGGEWNATTSPGPSALEWETLRADLSASVPESDLNLLEAHDKQAWQRGERVLFVPTFYAAGRVV